MALREGERALDDAEGGRSREALPAVEVDRVAVEADDHHAALTEPGDGGDRDRVDPTGAVTGQLDRPVEHGVEQRPSRRASGSADATHDLDRVQLDGGVVAHRNARERTVTACRVQELRPGGEAARRLAGGRETIDETVGERRPTVMAVGSHRRARDGLGDAWPGETDRRVRVGENDVAQQAVGGEHPTGRGVAEVGERGDAGLPKGADPFCRADHLQEREHALLRPGTAGGGEGDERQQVLPGVGHRGGDERAVGATHRTGQHVEASAGRDDLDVTEGEDADVDRMGVAVTADGDELLAVAGEVERVVAGRQELDVERSQLVTSDAARVRAAQCW